jgi:hypothetical protein
VVEDDQHVVVHHRGIFGTGDPNEAAHQVVALSSCVCRQIVFTWD